MPGSISMKYDVDTNGQTINIEVIESTPKGIIDREASKIINRVIYRPKYIDAEPQSTEGLSISHQFNVRLSGIENEKDKESGSEITEEPLDEPLENPIG